MQWQTVQCEKTSFLIRSLTPFTPSTHLGRAKRASECKLDLKPIPSPLPFAPAMSWSWKGWGWYGKGGDEKESKETKTQTWDSPGYSNKKDQFKESEQVGEVSDREVEATVVTKVKLQKRKQFDQRLQEAAEQTAALRANIFAQHGASTLAAPDLENKDASRAPHEKGPSGM